MDHTHILEKSCHLQIMEINCDFQQISIILPAFWILPWYGNFFGNLLEVSRKLLEVQISMIWRGHDLSSDIGEGLDTRLSKRQIGDRNTARVREKC